MARANGIQMPIRYYCLKKSRDTLDTTGIKSMISRRNFLMIAALQAIPVLHTSLQETEQTPKKKEAGVQEVPAPHDRIPDNHPVVINPGHYRYSGENLGTYVPGIGREYIINTQISCALQKKLQDIEIPSIVTRDEQNYLPEVLDFIADRNTRLEAEYDAYIRATKGRRHRELGRREAILQLGTMRFAESRGAAAMINIHVDDQIQRKRKKRTPEAKGFSVILNKTASSDSERLQHELCSALHKTLPLNRCYHIKSAKKGIFILGNSELRFPIASCLVECGFMRQPYVIDGSEKHICDPEVQDLYATSLARGLANYVGISASEVL